MGQISSKRKILLSCKLIDSVPTSFAPLLLLHAVVGVVSQPPQFNVMAHKKVGKKKEDDASNPSQISPRRSLAEDFHNASSSIPLHVYVREKLSTHHNTRRYRLSMRQCHRHTHAALKWIFFKKKRKKLRTPHHIKILCYVLQAIQLLFGYFVGRQRENLWVSILFVHMTLDSHPMSEKNIEKI